MSLAVILSGLLSCPVAAEPKLVFAQENYEVHVGQSLMLDLVLDADDTSATHDPPPAGLLSYGWRLDFIPFVLELDRVVVAEPLDYFFDARQPARVITEPGAIRVKGSVQANKPYQGVSLGQVRMINRGPVDSSYQIAISMDRDFPTEQVFLDGEGHVFDQLLQFGSATVTVVPLLGDFDDDGELSDVDIDLLCEQIRAEANLTGFDLNGDGQVNTDDQAHWLAIRGVLAGDADLDGRVAFADFLSLSNNFGMPGQWATGDFDCSGDVQFVDFLLLSENFGKSAAALSQTVPEPAIPCWCLAACVIAAISRLTRGRRLRCFATEKPSPFTSPIPQQPRMSTDRHGSLRRRFDCQSNRET